MSISAEKSRLRGILKARRARLTPQSRWLANVAIMNRLMGIGPVRAGEVFFVYVSVGTEVSTRSLIDRLQNLKRAVLVPRIDKGQAMKAVPFPGWRDMRAGALGIPSPPPGPAYDRDVDVVIVPGIGFTPDGRRLGYGGGYYDGWLNRNRSHHNIAVAFENQMVDDLATDAHDVGVDLIITEQRLIETGNRSGN